MGKLALLVAAAGILLTACHKKTTYPDEWSHGTGAAFDKIAVTLGRNNIRGCGDFWYKLADGQDNGEAVVYCLQRDPVKIRDLTVFYEIQKVNEGSDYMGPLPPFGK